MKLLNNTYSNIMVKYLRPHLLKLTMLTLGIIVSIGLQLANPQIIKYFIDSALAGKPLDILINAAILFIAFAFVQQLVQIWTTYLSKKLGWQTTNALRKDLYQHCLDLDMSYHKSLKPGEIIERIDGDVNILLNFLSQFIVVVVNNILLILGVLVLLYREDYRIGIAETIMVIITAFVFVKIKSIATPHWKKVREISSQFYGFIGEHLSSTEDLKANGAENYTMSYFHRMLRKWFPLQYKASITGYSMFIATLFLTGISHTIAFGLGGYLWSKGIITIGAVYLFYSYNQYLTTPVNQIRNQLQDFQRAMASIQRIDELLKTKSKIQQSESKHILTDSFDITVRNMNFEYEDNVSVLEDISFKLEKGKVLGILGRTGSGKTTLARLLTRLYDIKSGQIKYGTYSIDSISLENLREHVAYVTQDVQLFQASVRDNITFFNDEISDQRIIEIIEELGLGDWYRLLPNGLDTILDANGGNLSAGEAQLLAFVRVFLRNPSLVIMDEASSRLDPATERLIQSAIFKLLKGRSGIIIAHRLSTINHVDDVMILEKGKIIEVDSRQVLEADSSSVFSSLLKTGMEEVLV